MRQNFLTDGETKSKDYLQGRFDAVQALIDTCDYVHVDMVLAVLGVNMETYLEKQNTPSKNRLSFADMTGETGNGME